MGDASRIGRATGLDPENGQVTYVAVEQAEWGVEIQSEGPRKGSKSRVEIAFTELRKVDMEEHFGNVDRSDCFIEALYQYCLMRRAEATSERRASP